MPSAQAGSGGGGVALKRDENIWPLPPGTQPYAAAIAALAIEFRYDP